MITGDSNQSYLKVGKIENVAFLLLFVPWSEGQSTHILTIFPGSSFPLHLATSPHPLALFPLPLPTLSWEGLQMLLPAPPVCLAHHTILSRAEGLCVLGTQ